MDSAASAAIQNGIARSVFSNEAGQGSSTMVHSQAKVEHPVRQGMWGMFEVFVARGYKNNIKNLFNMFTDGELEDELTKMREFARATE